MPPKRAVCGITDPCGDASLGGWCRHGPILWMAGWLAGHTEGHTSHLPPPMAQHGDAARPSGGSRAAWLPAAALPTRQAPLAAGAAGRVLRRRIRFGAGRAGRDALKSHEYESAAPGGSGRSNLSLVTVTGVTNTPTPGQGAGGGQGTGLPCCHGAPRGSHPAGLQAGGLQEGGWPVPIPILCHPRGLLEPHGAGMAPPGTGTAPIDPGRVPSARWHRVPACRPLGSMEMSCLGPLLL